MLQSAVATDSFATYMKYAEGVYALAPIHVRNLLDFKADAAADRARGGGVDHPDPQALQQRQHVARALSREAHETLAIAMKPDRRGRRAAGEGRPRGGSASEPRDNGDNASSATKQIASARFGVTAEYLNHCREIEIKMAQGAKPGEGRPAAGLQGVPRRSPGCACRHRG